MSSNGSPTSFMTTSPPSTKSNILHSRSFILFRGHTFLHWLNLRPFSNMFISRGSDLNLQDIWSLKRGDSIQISALSPHMKSCKLTCTRCTTAEFVQCIDSRAITCSSRFCSIYQFPEQLLRAVTGALQATAKRGGRDPNDPRNDLSRLPVNLKSTPLFTFRISPEMISAEYLSKFLV